MKTPHLIPLAALTLLLAGGCHKPSSEVAKQIAELERKTQQAVERQQQLEQQIQAQQLAAERAAVERERMEIEEARAALDRQQGENAAAEAEKLRQREQDFATREGKLEQLQSTLEKQRGELEQQDQQLSARDRDLAGREALDFNDEGEAQAAVGDYGMFYDSLASYGSWFETPDYGYVWQPVIVVQDTGWRPYSRGSWVCSDRGWTWISDEPFGWATYHYGRWAPLRGHGWVWVPGSEWAPSWVSWRYSDRHVGWAPLPPETLAYSGHHWDSSVEATFGIGANWFNFVEIRHFGGPAHRHCLPSSQNAHFIQQTRNITNIHLQNRQVICGGPAYREVCERSGRTLPFYRLDMDHHNRPGRDGLTMQPQFHGDRLRMAAPNMDVAWNHGLKPNRVKGRLESVTVERSEPLRAEITEQFRQSREQEHHKAEESITQLGGREKFNQHRMEQLDSNRRLVDAATRESERKQAANKKETAGTHPPGPAAPSLRPTRNARERSAEAIQGVPEQAGNRQDGMANLHGKEDSKRPPADATPPPQPRIEPSAQVHPRAPQRPPNTALAPQPLETNNQDAQTPGKKQLAPGKPDPRQPQPPQLEAQVQPDKALKQQQVEAQNQRQQQQLQLEAQAQRDKALKQQQQEAENQRQQQQLQQEAQNQRQLQLEAQAQRDKALKQQQDEAQNQRQQQQLQQEAQNQRQLELEAQAQRDKALKQQQQEAQNQRQQQQLQQEAQNQRQLQLEAQAQRDKALKQQQVEAQNQLQQQQLQQEAQNQRQLQLEAQAQRDKALKQQQQEAENQRQQQQLQQEAQNQRQLQLEAQAQREQARQQQQEAQNQRLQQMQQQAQAQREQARQQLQDNLRREQAGRQAQEAQKLQADEEKKKRH